ncbi:MAG: permease [Deltaproteobacteria bacterium]|nr:permease [Deltaproteobacteria bacterium]
MRPGEHGAFSSVKPWLKKLIFPGIVLVIYGLLFIVSPDKASRALSGSAGVLLKLMFPLGLIFTLMVVMNLFLNPAHIAKFLGKGTGVKGTILSAAAGIISMGPIYVWYPLLKELKEKGAANPLIAIFLGNRAVKPFLLPIMISYFGWIYVLLLTLFTITGSFVTGYLVGVIVEE